MTTTHESLRELIRQCTACSARDEATAPVPFEGSIYSKIMFIGRNPGGTEDKQGRPFVGPGGELLNSWLTRADIDRDLIMITNLLKCYTHLDREPKQPEIDTCTKLWLHNELNKMSPKIVIPLGKQAMHYFLPDVKVGLYQGVWYPMRDRTIFYLHHPGYVLRGGVNRDLWLGFADQFKREHQEYL